MTPSPVFVGELALAQLASIIRGLQARGEQVLLVTVESCLAWHKPLIKEYFPEVPTYIAPSGEAAKTLKAYKAFGSALAVLPMGRGGAIIAMGGGSLLDMAGFTAATYARGISFYSIPTTLLAMADAAIGGKTGLNLPEGKNLLGAFHSPLGIFINPSFLETLPKAEIASGMAEIIKAGLLGAPGLWKMLQDNLPLEINSPMFLSVLQGATDYKTAVVKADPYEKATEGLCRSFLNLGHTFAHAIETVTGYRQYRHGEAVAIGLMLALELSEKHLGLDVKLRYQLKAILEAYQLPTVLPAFIDRTSLITAMCADKKAQQGRPRFVLLKALGEPYMMNDVSLNEIEALLA